MTCLDHSLTHTVSEHPLTVNMLKGGKILAESAWERFNHIFSSLWENLICKISPLVRCWILGVFGKTLTANDKHPVRDCGNLSSLIQMQSSLKPKTFAKSFAPFLESTSNFKRFEQKDDRHCYFILEITDCEWLG